MEPLFTMVPVTPAVPVSMLNTREFVPFATTVPLLVKLASMAMVPAPEILLLLVKVSVPNEPVIRFAGLSLSVRLPPPFSVKAAPSPYR